MSESADMTPNMSFRSSNGATVSIRIEWEAQHGPAAGPGTTMRNKNRGQLPVSAFLKVHEKWNQKISLLGHKNSEIHAGSQLSHHMASVGSIMKWSARCTSKRADDKMEEIT